MIQAQPARRTDSGSRSVSPWSKPLMLAALRDSFVKLNPKHLLGNPVVLVVEAVAAYATFLLIVELAQGASLSSLSFNIQIALWLWFTVLFSNFAEALAESRGKAQADSLRRTRSGATARRLKKDGGHEEVPAADLRMNDVVLVQANELIPGDGEVIEGVAYVNEAAITGESAPVLKEPGTDIRSSVTGGTTVVSDSLKVRITANPGSSFVDRMISLVEGAVRHKTPSEISLGIILNGLTLAFLIVVVTLQPFAVYSGRALSLTVLAALLVTLMPTTIGALMSAIGLAGMDRLARRNVLAMSGRAVEASGDIGTLLLDKTGTITFGNRQAAEFMPVKGVPMEELVKAAVLASVMDETPEGRSVLELAGKLGCKHIVAAAREVKGQAIDFSAETRVSGVSVQGKEVLKGAADAILKQSGGAAPAGLKETVDRVASQGGTPLVVMRDGKVLGVIYLKDTLKPGMREKFAELRRMGIRTVMITGDNPVTAKTIAEEAGVDDFVAESTPEDKIRLTQQEQAQGRLVAMTGDGTNDAPALAQADVGVAMNSGTAAAREAGNMVDLDNDPAKLIEIVKIGKQLLITRGALTTFSVANDVAKYFTILPAALIATYSSMDSLNVMRLGSPESAILSAVIFNALIIIALVPLAIRGVPYTPMSTSKLLTRNLLTYGLGGVITPFIGIKVIDVLVNWLHLV